MARVMRLSRDCDVFTGPGGAMECSHGWSEAQPVARHAGNLPRRGRGGFEVRRHHAAFAPSGQEQEFAIHALALRSTRGYSPWPLRGLHIWMNKGFTPAVAHRSIHIV
jgi:hypothetical protein